MTEDRCVCGVRIGLTARKRWVHLDDLPKGTPEDHVAVPDRTTASPDEPPASVAGQQVETLRHIVAALAWDEASPEELRDLTAIGFGLATTAWQSSVVAGLEARRG